ncbi:hypothetical protein LTR17_005331 [Elasticomyces elasticus]|nr:hypothetical protein LTR17_005331 [Elasticomyces elasticus]
MAQPQAEHETSSDHVQMIQLGPSVTSAPSPAWPGFANQTSQQIYEMGMRHAQRLAAVSVTIVDHLDVPTVRSLLKTAVSESTDVSKHVWQAWQAWQAHQDLSDATAIAREERRTASLDFSQYSRKVWHVLNKKYISESERVEENNGWPATDEIRAFVLAILDETHAQSSYGTKKSAVITLQNIARSINVAPSRLGNEVIQNMSFDLTVPKAMQDILKSMSMVEKMLFSECIVGSSRFVDQVVELERISIDHGMWEGEIEKVVALLRGWDGEYDETDDEEEMDG